MPFHVALSQARMVSTSCTLGRDNVFCTMFTSSLSLPSPVPERCFPWQSPAQHPALGLPSILLMPIRAESDLRSLLVKPGDIWVPCDPLRRDDSSRVDPCLVLLPPPRDIISCQNRNTSSADIACYLSTHRWAALPCCPPYHSAGKGNFV